MTIRLGLTATELQARQFREQHNAARVDAGDRVWPAPQILSLDRWLRDQWLKSWPPEQLLSASQESLLWQQLVAADPQANDLLAPDALSQALQASWQRAARWRIDVAQGPHWSAEQRLFARLAARLQSQLAARQAITSSQLSDAAISAIASGQWRPPAAVDLLSPRAALAPDQRAVVAALEAVGVRVSEIALSPTQPTITALSCRDESAQWVELARQLDDILDRGEQALVVVPRLDQALCHSMALHWQDRLAPWQLSGRDPLAPPPWQFEPAAALAEQPAVDAACLATLAQPYDNRFDELSRLLLHPVIFSLAQRCDTGRIEARLRERGPRYPIGSLLALLPSEADPALQQRLSNWVQCIQQAPRRARASQWLAHWQARWQALDIAISGSRWPLAEEFDQALLEFQGLDEWLGEVTANTATRWLMRIVQAARYRPPARAAAPIRIVDMASAAGLSTPQLLLANLSSRAWPLPARPDPFLPLDALIAAGDPSASAAGSLALARQQLDQLLSRSGQVTAYCPRVDAQGAAASPSRLLPADWREPPAAQPLPRTARVSPVTPAADPAPPISASRLAKQRGGIRVVQAQAYGGFFAFARYRLGVSALPVPALGLSASVQGQWIHAVLQDFWQQHRRQSVLLDLDDAALLDDLGARIAGTAATYMPASRYGAGLRALESDRILRACHDWLKHEKRRVEPFEVLHCEQELEDQIAGLPLALRIDRIDRVATAQGPRYLLIDYKTGTSDRSRFWQTSLFFEPQLPLYAVSESLRQIDIPTVDGICFAQVVEDAPAFIASLNWRRQLITEDTRAYWIDWPQTLLDWRARIHQLIMEFQQGSIQVDMARNYDAQYAIADLLPLIDAPAATESDDE